jgi:hypothetical protein
LKSSTAYETLDRSVLRPRLLLGLNGIGTNAGFQRMAGLQSGTTAKDLAYVRRRYITVETPGLVVRELGGYWRAASLARMTVCRLGVPRAALRFYTVRTLISAVWSLSQRLVASVVGFIMACNMEGTPCLRSRRHIARQKRGLYPGVEMACNTPP